MSTPWAATIASTLAWGGLDAIRKGLSERLEVAPLALWISLAQLPGYLVWAIFEGNWSIRASYVAPGLISIALNIVANIAFFEAMRISPLSITIPMLSFTPVFVALASGPWLGEHLAVQQWAGIALVTVGAFLLSASGNSGSSRWALLRSFFGQRGVRLMLWVSVFWALTPLADKTAMKSAGVGVHGLFLAAGVALGMALYLLARGRLRQAVVPRKLWPLLALGGCTNVVAQGTQLVAISTMVVSLFEAFKRALGLLLALASGRVFFGEPLTVQKTLAGLVMATGVVLVLVR